MRNCMRVDLGPEMVRSGGGYKGYDMGGIWDGGRVGVGVELGRGHIYRVEVGFGSLTEDWIKGWG